MNYQIKLASFKEVQLMLEWAYLEKWNPGLNDAALYQMIDLKGFFIGYIEDEPVSCISTVKYTSQFGFLGLYIVKPQFRGQGLGYQIWQHAMNYAGQTNIGLDGVPAQQANYKKSGFKFAHRNIRYALPVNRFIQDLDKNIILANSLPLHAIVQYDQSCFPCERTAFLTSWLLMSNARALVYFDKGIKGYGVIRACSEGYKIGPLFADNRQVARTLLLALVESVDKNSGQTIYLDIPEINLEANALVNELAMNPVFETARMYTQQAPNLAINKIFGITSFEVG